MNSIPFYRDFGVAGELTRRPRGEPGPARRGLLRRDAEMNCSKDSTPRLRLWSTVRWGALNIESSSPQTRRRPK